MAERTSGARRMSVPTVLPTTAAAAGRLERRSLSFTRRRRLKQASLGGVMATSQEHLSAVDALDAWSTTDEAGIVSCLDEMPAAVSPA
eukprot:3172553-Prymnesium_polylepis.1